MRASGYFFFTRSRRLASTSATATSFTFGCDAIPSSVEYAIPLAPKLARRRVPEGGFDSNSRTKNGALPATRKNDRRLLVTGLFYPGASLRSGARHRPFRDAERINSRS